MRQWSMGTIGVVLFAAVAALAWFSGRRMRGKTSPLENPEDFARIVVAEIRLYAGQAKVTQSISRGTVYRDMKDDIDRSRRMFLARFPDADQVFFRALVATLAGGNESCIGGDYPYQRG